MAASTNVGSVDMELTLNSKSFDNSVKSKTKETESAFNSSMKKIGGYILAAFSIKAVVGFAKSSIDAASKIQSAWTGLKSIADGTGKSFTQAQEFITQYTKDGLVTVSDAVTAYKNLLARGYDTKQIENTMKALKDSAAFGRQSSYSLSEAIVSATEGLKNENSILVDNAGVTKNVAKMWEDYAKKHNTTTSAMTQAQKIEAEYNGILEETKFQTGDAATYTQTFGGKVQGLSAAFNNMKVAIGSVITPIAELFIPILTNAINVVTEFFNKVGQLMSIFGLKFPTTLSKTNSAINAVGGSADNTSKQISNTGKAAKKAANEINKAFSKVDEINVLGNNKNTNINSSISSPNVSSIGNPLQDSEEPIDSSIQKIADKLKSIGSIIKEAWNSEPVQAFSNATITYGQYIFDFWKTLGTSLFDNMSTTWSNIEGNVSTSIGNISILWTNMWTDFASGIETWGQPIIDGVNNLFNSIWETAIDPAIQLMSQGWADFSEILVNLWDKHGKPLIDNIGEFATSVIDLFQSIYDNVLEPIITPLLETLSWLWDEHLSVVVEKIGDFIGKLVNGALEIWNKFLEPIVSALLDVLAPAWSFVSTTIIGVLGSILAVISDVFGGIMDVLGGIVDFIVGIFTGNIGKAFDGIVSVIKGIVDTIIGIVKFPINLIIDLINGFIGGLNKIKVPDWVPGLGGKGINIPKIPKLAQGGYVAARNPQLAIIGDNKREGEIVSPESKIYDQVDKALKANGGTSQKQELEITIYHKYEDGKTIIQKINQEQIDAGRILLYT